MWDNGSPNNGGSGSGTGGGTPPARPVHAPRCTAPGTTRATLNRRALHVWLQAVDQLSTNCADATQIANTTRTRLQSLFTLVARRPGQPHVIQVLWTTDISSETVGRRDIVIYFVNCFAPGTSGSRRARGSNSVVERYLREREAATSGSTATTYRQLRQQFFNPLTTPGEAGLCIADTDNTPPASSGTSACEAYTDVIAAANAIPAGVANRSDFVNNQGFALAGIAFHEAMHNKIDPFHGSSWNLHTSGGGGLALGNFGGSQTHTSANIRLMGQYIYRPRRQYILRPSTPQPTTTSPGTPAGAAQPATPGSAVP